MTVPNVRSNSECVTSKSLMRSRGPCSSFKSKRFSTIRWSEIMLSSWPNSKRRREKCKKRLNQSESRTLSCAIRYVKSQRRPSRRNAKSSKNTRRALKNTLKSLESSPALKRRLSQSLKINTRRFRKSTNGRWTICKKN